MVMEVCPVKNKIGQLVEHDFGLFYRLNYQKYEVSSLVPDSWHISNHKLLEY